MSTVTITVFSAVILIFVLNNIIEHLFNWWFREWTDDIMIVPVFAYLIKTGILVLSLFELLY
jgi:hypothetical protein